MLREALVVVCGMFLAANALAAPDCAIEPCRATVRDLVEQPGSFEGRRVRVEGVLNLRFEVHSIRHGELRLSLDLYRPPDPETGAYDEKKAKEDWARIEKWRRAGLQGRWVEVIGVFTKETGHFSMMKHGFGLRDIEAIVPTAASRFWYSTVTCLPATIKAKCLREANP